MFEVEMVLDLSETLVMIAKNVKVCMSIKTFVFIIDKSNIGLEFLEKLYFRYTMFRLLGLITAEEVTIDQLVFVCQKNDGLERHCILVFFLMENSFNKKKFENFIKTNLTIFFQRKIFFQNSKKNIFSKNY